MSAREQWTARFDALVQSRNEPAWMTALRKKAWDRFLELGLPTRRDERWKYTSLLAFGRNPFATPERITSELSFEVDGIEAVATLSHINGITHLGSSDLGRLGVEMTVRPLAEAWEDAREALERRCEAIQDGVQALQFAFATDGAIVFIGNDVEMTAPIRLTRRTDTPNAFAPVFDHIVVGRHAQALLIERYEGSATASTSGGICDIVVKDGANFEHVIVQEEPHDVWHVRSVDVDIARDASYRAFTLAAGGRLGRHEHQARFSGEGVQANLDALTLGKGSQVIDHCTVLNHALPNGKSHQLNRVILDDKAHGIFNGTVVVAIDAQQTDAFQMNNNLLLSDEARADTRPQLEIAADDVKCGHGATLGQLNDDEIFYLMSRAIPKNVARRMLLGGFASEAVDTIQSPALKSLVATRVRRWLDQLDAK